MKNETRFPFRTNQPRRGPAARTITPRVLVLAMLRLKSTSEAQKSGKKMIPVTLQHGQHSNLFGQESTCTVEDPEDKRPVTCTFNVAPEFWPKLLVQQVPSLQKLAKMEALLNYMVYLLKCNPDLAEQLDERLRNNESIVEILKRFFPNGEAPQIPQQD